MGQTFANITVKGQTQKTLVNYLKNLKRNAYVSPSVVDFVVVYDEEIEADLEELSNLSIQISEDFNCLTFAIFVYDSAIARNASRLLKAIAQMPAKQPIVIKKTF